VAQGDPETIALQIAQLECIRLESKIADLDIPQAASCIQNALRRTAFDGEILGGLGPLILDAAVVDLRGSHAVGNESSV